jgi:hypothetical protein
VRNRIKELQAATKDLSREEAFKIAVMEEGRKSLDTLGSTADLASTKVDKLKAAVQDAKIGIGELLVESVGGAEGVDKLASRIRMLPDTINQVGMVLGAYGATVRSVWGEHTTLREALDVFQGQLKANVIANQDLFQATEIVRFAYTQRTDVVRELTQEEMAAADALEQYVTELGKAEISTPKAAEASQNYIDELGGVSFAAVRAAEAIQAQTEATNASIQSQLGLAESLKGATEAQIASAAIGELKGALDEGQISFEDYSTAVGEVQLSFGLADEASVNLSKRLASLVTRFGEGQVGATAFDDELARLIELNTIENEQIALFGELLTTTSETIATTTEVETEFAGALDRTAQDTQASKEALDERVVSIGENVQATSELSTATDALSEKLETLNTWFDELPEQKTIKVKVDIESSGSLPGNVGIPALQHGGSFRGAAIVGEGGQPEMVFAPGGATVVPMNQLTTNNNFNMTVNTGQQAGSVIDDFEVMQALAQ